MHRLVNGSMTVFRGPAALRYQQHQQQLQTSKRAAAIKRRQNLKRSRSNKCWFWDDNDVKGVMMLVLVKRQGIYIERVSKQRVRNVCYRK